MFKAIITAALAVTATSAAAVSADYEAKVVGYAYGVAFECEIDHTVPAGVMRAHNGTEYQNTLDDCAWGLYKASTNYAVAEIREKGCDRTLIVAEAILEEVGR
jgi:uncharacterized membrane protein